MNYPVKSIVGFSTTLLLFGALSFSTQNIDLQAEKKIIDYLRNNLKAGQPVVITKLYNEVFTSPQERKALDRLYNIFFKVPAFIAQYYTTSQKPPTLQEIAYQFRLPLEGEADVILRIIDYDRRVPRFITRDASTGEISHVDIDKIKADPRFHTTWKPPAVWDQPCKRSERSRSTPDQAL